MLICSVGNRQVTLPIEKHEHSRPFRREPSSLVLIGTNIGGISQSENKDKKSSIFTKDKELKHIHSRLLFIIFPFLVA